MNWLTIFAGLFFIMMGAGMLLRAFGIDLPLMRIVVALFIIFIGIKILLPGAFRRRGDRGSGEGGTAAFGETSVSRADGKSADYSVVFGSRKIDLTKVDLSKGDVRITVSAAFGSAEIKTDPKTPIKLVANAAFGSVEWPGGNSAMLGSNTYKSEAFKEGAPALYVEANAALGSIEIK